MLCAQAQLHYWIKLQIESHIQFHFSKTGGYLKYIKMMFNWQSPNRVNVPCNVHLLQKVNL